MPFTPKKKSKKSFDKPPNKTANEALGGMPKRKKAADIADTMDKGLGNIETGFLQRTPLTATASMMGRAPPKGLVAKSSTRQDGKKQFKPRGKKVF